MTRKMRLGLLACAGILAVAGAGNALASYKPKLAINDDATGVTINFTQPSGDDPTARLVFYAPLGYSLYGGKVGSTIGTLTAQAAAADLGGATLPLTGTVQVRDVATGTLLSTTTPTIAAAATLCTGTASHLAAWVLVLSAAGQTLEVPLFIDPVTGPLAAVASTQIVVCLPPPDVPAGTVGRASFGAKVFQAIFKVRGVLTPPTGSTPYLWRMVATPYTPGAGKANAAGTVEAQSVVTETRAITATASGKTVSGTVTVGGTGVAGVKVNLVSSRKVVGTATTSSSGAFTASVKKGGQVLARAWADPKDLPASACIATLAALGVPCIGSTSGGFTIASVVLTVK